jgi:hypothetical protein
MTRSSDAHKGVRREEKSDEAPPGDAVQRLLACVVKLREDRDLLVLMATRQVRCDRLTGDLPPNPYDVPADQAPTLDEGIRINEALQAMLADLDRRLDRLTAKIADLDAEFFGTGEPPAQAVDGLIDRYQVGKTRARGAWSKKAMQRHAVRRARQAGWEPEKGE